jgi:hypothetical protein
MRAAGKALLDVGASKLNALLGALCILHTWGQNQMLHPHVHCVVPGGGFRPGKKAWVSVRKPTFFLPVKVLSRRFRTLLTNQLRQAFIDGKLERLPAGVASDLTEFKALLARAWGTDWVVYTKAPFGGPAQVLQYLSAYTHRLAISNKRIVRFDGKKVWFRWKDYKDRGKSKTMELDGLEFLRRFVLHILPPRFVRIRYFGFLGNRNRAANIDLARQLIGTKPIVLREPRERLAIKCPDCKEGSLIIVGLCEVLPARAPRAPPLLREAS